MIATVEHIRKFIFALVDCKNFYVSCERAFNSRLWKKPVIVLGNNDGIIIARSDEAKQLGIPMGFPVFLVRKIIKDNDVIVKSANFPLYFNMRDRVRGILSEFTPHLEKYSIDECFLDLTAFPPDQLDSYGRQIKEMVERCTGIPVQVGIAETKCLAKLANKVAKKKPELKGVLSVYGNLRWRERALEVTDVGDLWGVGPAYATMLKSNGINNALQFRDAPEHWVQKKMTIMGARIQAELKAIKCHSLSELPEPKKMIGTAAGVGVLMETLEEMLQEAAARAEEEGWKLRKENVCAKEMVVWVSTNPFSADPKHNDAREFTLPVATNNTSVIAKLAQACVKEMYKNGHRYKRVGVHALTLEPANCVQGDIFVDYEDPKKVTLMRVMDQLNQERGTGTVRIAATGPTGVSRTLFQNQSPHYTSRWSDLPIARAC